MKVIYFHTGNWYGGVEKLLIDLFDYRLESPEIEPVFILCYKGILSKELKKRGAIVEIITAPQHNKPWTMMRTRFQLWQKLKKHKCKLVVSHEIDNHVVAFPVERWLKIKTVLWIHSSGFRLRSAVYKKLDKKMPEMTVCTSNHVQQEVNRLWPSMKTDYLYHPYAKPFFEPKNIDHKKELTFIYVGRLVEYKGLHIIIEALGKIKNLPFQLVVVGGAQRDSEKRYLVKCKTRSTELGISHKIGFMGYQKNVLAFFNKADVFVHPNTLPEPLGLVFMEALFTQTPIVATNIGGAKEILGLQPLKMGDLVPPDDVEALATVLKKYIEDGDYRLQITKNIKDGFVNICDPTASMKKLAHILQSL